MDNSLQMKHDHRHRNDFLIGEAQNCKFSKLFGYYKCVTVFPNSKNVVYVKHFVEDQQKLIKHQLLFQPCIYVRIVT